MRVANPIRVVLLTAVVLTLSLPVVAMGKPFERERYHNSDSQVIDDFCDVAGMTVLEQFDEYVNVNFNTRGKEGIAYFSATLHGWIEWTNLSNGKTLRQVWNFVDKDQEITDNGDGTLTIRIKNAGSSKVYGPDGKLLFNDPGQIQFEILIDHGGTPNDPNDDEFVDFLGVVKGSTGRNDLADRDFCEDIETYIGT